MDLGERWRVRRRKRKGPPHHKRRSVLASKRFRVLQKRANRHKAMII